MEQHTEGTPHGIGVKSYRFDLFKGAIDGSGRVRKVRTLGGATLETGSSTYRITVRMLPSAEFFLLPERKEGLARDYRIMTREPSRRRGRLYFWHEVGEAFLLGGDNSGILSLSWDLFGAPDLYMNMAPTPHHS